MGLSLRDVVIIGGGISGAAAAYELARAGASVTLLEKGALASMASGWTLAGVRQSGRHAAELPLAAAAVRRWEQLADELDSDVGYRQEGNLRLARTPEEVPTIANLVREQRARGLEVTFLDGNQAVRAVAPALAETIVAASYCPSDGHADPIATVHAFVAAAQRHGAAVRTDTKVTALNVAGGRVRGVQTGSGAIAADAVVIAAGVYSDELCALVGLDLPITVRLTGVVQTTPVPLLLRQVLGVANADFAGRQQVDGRLRMSGSVGEWRWPNADRELGAEDVLPPAHNVASIITRGVAVLPALAEARVARVWAGLIDMTPDGLPVIERAPGIEGLVIAAGFSGHGFCLGPVTGRIVCELIAHGRSTLPIEAFRSARFAGMSGTANTELHG
jgi:glycine/D-amino acid oxidase-like deaminating enzyme